MAIFGCSELGQAEKRDLLHQRLASLYNSRESDKYRLPGLRGSGDGDGQGKGRHQVEDPHCLYAAKLVCFNDKEWYR